jgi:hypothetical protein
VASVRRASACPRSDCRLSYSLWSCHHRDGVCGSGTILTTFDDWHLFRHTT